jgi:hypothetical protein
MNSKIVDLPINILEVKQVEIIRRGAKLWSVTGCAESETGMKLGVFEFKGTLNQLLRVLKKHKVEEVTIFLNDFWRD